MNRLGTITWFLDKSYRLHRPDIRRVRSLSNRRRSFYSPPIMSRGKKSQRQSNIIVVAEDMWRQLNVYRFATE